MKERGMETEKKFCNYDGQAYDENKIQLMVISKKL